jgi:hypothetical protein
MATASYLDDVAGGMVAAAAFEDDDAAVSAVTLLRESGVREQDISVIAQDRHRAALVAGGRAWLPLKGWRGLMVRLLAMAGRDLPRDVRQRYGKALDAGKIVVIVAAGGQPADTIAALLKQSRGDQIEQWLQPPTMLFAPPELAGPF